MAYMGKNYRTDGGDRTVIGGVLEFTGEGSLSGFPGAKNQAASTAGSYTALKDDFNALLIKLKDAGIMVPDSWGDLTVTKSINDTVSGHKNRQDNTEDIFSVAEEGGIITITLSKKVSELKDFDGGNGWGTHKWLGIGIRPWTEAATGIIYNGSKLTAEDVSEATGVGLTDTGYFVRWVAADLVLAEDNTQKSKDTFTIGADGYETLAYKLRIAEPAEE